MSERVEVMTRAVNVEALNECSAYKISDTSKQRMTSFSGTSPKHIWKKFSENPRSLVGAIGASPRRRRCSKATTVGSFAIIESDLAKFASVDGSSSVGSDAPIRLTAVRITSIGWQ